MQFIVAILDQIHHPGSFDKFYQVFVFQFSCYFVLNFIKKQKQLFDLSPNIYDHKGKVKKLIVYEMFSVYIYFQKEKKK